MDRQELNQVDSQSNEPTAAQGRAQASMLFQFTHRRWNLKFQLNVGVLIGMSLGLAYLLVQLLNNNGATP